MDELGDVFWCAGQAEKIAELEPLIEGRFDLLKIFEGAKGTLTRLVIQHLTQINSLFFRDV